MSEVAPAPAAEQPQVQQPAAQDMPIEDRLAKAMGLPQVGERPRDDKGRFAAQQQEQQPAPAEQPKSETAQPAAEEKPAEAAPQEEVKWDDVKDVKVKIPMKDGDKEWTEELSLEQLRAGRMLQADYTKKTTEIAEREKKAQAETAQAIERERTQYLQTLTTLHQSVMQAAAPELATVDWKKLAEENPAEYVRLSNRAREVNEALQRIRLEHDKTLKQQSEQRQARFDQAAVEAKQKLKEAIPAWNDDLYQSLLKRGVESYGFSPDEVGQVYDHRVMRVLHDAHQWQMLQQGKPTAEKKVVNVPPVLRPGNVKPKVDAQAQQFQSAQDRLRKNGNDQDAAAAVMAGFLTPRQGRAQ